MAAGKPAAFSAQSGYTAGKTIGGRPGELFDRILSVGVDSEGDIYVGNLNREGSDVAVYAPSGKYLTKISAGEAVGLGNDGIGTVYTAEGSFVRGWFVEPYPPAAEATFLEAGGVFEPAAGIAADPAGNDLLLSKGNRIEELSSASSGLAPVTVFGGDQLSTGGGSAIAVDASTGATADDVYVANGTAIERYGPLINGPDVATEPASAIDSGAGAATLNGTVTPLGEAVTECFFEYGTSPALGRTAPCVESGADIGTGLPARQRRRPRTARPRRGVAGADRDRPRRLHRLPQGRDPDPVQPRARRPDLQLHPADEGRREEPAGKQHEPLPRHPAGEGDDERAERQARRQLACRRAELRQEEEQEQEVGACDAVVLIDGAPLAARIPPPWPSSSSPPAAPGRPRASPTSRESLRWMIASAAGAFGLGPDDAFLPGSSMSHVGSFL